jgi:S1-C subfamily serine protease
VTLVATALVEPQEDPSLGLRLRNVARAGVQVLGVEPRSRADRAGIRTGDLITVIGPQKTPTAAQVARTFDAAGSGEKLLVGLTRGSEHHVVVLEKSVSAEEPRSERK